MSDKKKPSAWDVLGILSEDDELKQFGQRLDAVRYKVMKGRVLCWSVELDPVMRTLTEIEGKPPKDVWEVKRAKKTGETYCTCPSWRWPKKLFDEDGNALPPNRFCKHLAKLMKDGIEL